MITQGWRRHRQMSARPRVAGTPPRHRLFGRQGGDRELHAGAGGAARAPQYPGQRHRAQQDRLAGRPRASSIRPGRSRTCSSGPASPRGREGDPVPGERRFRRSSSARICSSTAAPGDGSYVLFCRGRRGNATRTYGSLPVQFGGLVALMRRASLTSSLTAPVTGSDRPALSVISATTCMSLSAQVKVIMSQSLSAAEAPELICSASRNLTRSMPVVSASRPGLDQSDRIDPEQQVVHGLADLAVADIAEMRIVGAEAAVDRPPALDHLGLAADHGQQRALVRRPAATADRSIQHPDAFGLRGRIDRLHGGRRHRRGDRDDRSLGTVASRPFCPWTTALTSSV